MFLNIASKFRAFSARKSRRDSTLLTVDFNLRTRGALYTRTSPAGTGLWKGDFVSSLWDFGKRVFSLFRRLKPPVNNVQSLRDFSKDITLLFFAQKYTIFKNQKSFFK